MASELIGVRELNQKLSKLDRALGIKTLGTGLRRAILPVKAQMKALIPVGSEAHRTYKKRLVAPGFARRSIKHITGKRYAAQGALSVAIGVKAEAWYAIRFLDQGPHTITRRRQQTRQKLSGHVGYRRRSQAIASYTLPKRPWFEAVFVANKDGMLKTFNNELEIAVRRAVRG